jgi:hypothetical protein
LVPPAVGTPAIFKYEFGNYFFKNLKSEDQLNKGKDQHKIKITIDNKTAALP